MFKLKILRVFQLEGQINSTIVGDFRSQLDLFSTMLTTQNDSSSVRS